MGKASSNHVPIAFNVELKHLEFEETKEWLFDSGSSHDLIGRMQNLANLDSFDCSEIVTIGNGS